MSDSVNCEKTQTFILMASNLVAMASNLIAIFLRKGTCLSDSFNCQLHVVHENDAVSQDRQPGVSGGDQVISGWLVLSKA